jgi:predicted CoA-binding protein
MGTFKGQEEEMGMGKGCILTEDDEILSVLEECRTIAVLGMSPRAERDSNEVGLYLVRAGYGVIPVYPGQKEISGLRAYEKTEDLAAGSVDIRLKPRVFWMQLGVENERAAERLMDAGIDVVMDRCIKVEHARLCR